MAQFRRLLIFGLNALVLGWLLKVLLFDQASDVVSLFGFATLLFLLFYNVYAVLIYGLFPVTERLKVGLETTFAGMLALPFVLLYILTN